MENICISLDEETKQKVDSIAEDEGRSKSNLIRRAIKFYLEKEVKDGSTT